MENKEFDIWLKEFIKKHTAKGSHRWAFWVEGILIGLLIGAIL
jgi:hypothetical protein|tara:strand:- start:2054 stop:2182 length:129 start_codon:yes stop_codon:yes gene_type:complete